MAVFGARKFEGTLQRCLLLLICLARRFYRVLGLRLFHAPVIQAFRASDLSICSFILPCATWSRAYFVAQCERVCALCEAVCCASLCWLRSAMRRCLALCSSISACCALFLSSSSASRFDFRACWSFANFWIRSRPQNKIYNATGSVEGVSSACSLIAKPIIPSRRLRVRCPRRLPLLQHQGQLPTPHQRSENRTEPL